MASDGYITYSTKLDNSDLVKELASAKRDIERLQKQIDSGASKRLPLADKVSEIGMQLDAAKEKLASLQSSIGYATNSKTTLKAVETAEKEIGRLQIKYDSASTKLERADAAAAKLKDELSGAKVHAAGLEKQLAKAQNLAPLTGQIENVEKRFLKFGKRIGTMLRRVFMFSVILAALRGVRSWFMDIVKRNDEASAAIARLKGALLTMAQPIVDVAIPAFTKLLNIMTSIISVLANAMARLFGTNIKDSANRAQALDKEGKAIKGVGAAAKKAAGYLASFDEINKVQDDDTSSAGADSGISADFSGIDMGKTQSELDKLTAILGGALLAVGAILAFSGVNIPLGITLMALGAAILYKEAALNWDQLPQTVRDAISGMLVLTGIVCLAVGLCLALSGANIPLGLGLIAVGAAALYAAASLNWGELGDTMYEKLANIGMIIGPVIAIVGVLLALTGNIPLGVAMIVAGAAIFGVSAAVLNWDELGNTTTEKLGNLLSIIGGFLCVIGVILMLTGVAFGWGLAMTIAGAALLVSGSIAAQWDSVPNTMQDKLGMVLRVIGGFLIVLGVILLFTGVGTPFAIGMILAGVASLAVGAVAPNWGFLLEKIKGCWKDIKQYWNTNIKKYFTIDYWKNKAGDIITGLVSGIKGGLGSIKTAFSDAISKAWSGVKGFFIGGSSSSSISGASTSVQASSARIYSADVPALARGAVIPPNREFMAVLGDQTSGNNIEAPEDLIRKIVREESGGSASLSVLQDILEAIRDGSVIMVDKRVLGKVVRETLANAARTSNTSTI